MALLREYDCRLGEVAYSQRQQQFGLAKHHTLTAACKRCPYLFTCYGECPKNRFVKSADGEPGHNYLCPGLNRYFTYVDSYLRNFADQIQRKRSMSAPGSTVQVVMRQ